MKRTNEPKWIERADGELAGVALGSDFCAEHEWGVEKMRRAFGCDEKKDGIARRMIRKLPEDLRFVSSPKFDAVFLSPSTSYYKQPSDWVREELRYYGDSKYYSGAASKLVCAWDEGTFGIVGYGGKTEADRTRVHQLWEAFQRKDIAFWPNVGPFHLGGGLIFCIASKVPDEDKAATLAADLDRKKMLKAAEETGIEAELTRAGKRWFALSPRWADNEKTAVMFWLNPYEQHIYAAGWFTVDELRQWTKDSGPVMKEKKRR